MRLFKKYLKEILLVVGALVFLSPVYIMLVNSFKSRSELYENVLALPETLTFEHYIRAMDRMNFGLAFFNSLVITIISVVIIRYFIINDSMDACA